ncbi:HNH endonuclease [Orenia marismortui]|uniref:HNH endonuclease n=1 Tax=Orenia marismortui TaxID=46469 RepID=UPI00036772A3|nr:HNH endonuclease [Orenia marismortui]
MSRNKFRNIHPKRTCDKVYKNYSSYKEFLAKDFNYKCGYCDDNSLLLGGPHNFHIDHFAPKKKFPELKSEYNNLVYSCPYCNQYKSDDWISDKADINIIDNRGYIDPCDLDYHNNFYRNKKGEIIPRTKVGIYMYRKLKLYLKRHSILWKIAKIRLLRKEIRSMLEDCGEDTEINDKLKNIYVQLGMQIDDFMDYLMGELKYD